MSKERIEEVARRLAMMVSLGDRATELQSKFAVVLKEFQATPCQWVQCSERWPDINIPVMWRSENGCQEYYSHRNMDMKKPIAWMEIPPYTAPESELVRRFRSAYKNAPEGVIDVIKQCEKELADGK